MRPVQLPAVSGMGNEYRPKCGHPLRLGSKGRVAHSIRGCTWQQETLGVNVPLWNGKLRWNHTAVEANEYVSLNNTVQCLWCIHHGIVIAILPSVRLINENSVRDQARTRKTTLRLKNVLPLACYNYDTHEWKCYR